MIERSLVTGRLAWVHCHPSSAWWSCWAPCSLAWPACSATIVTRQPMCPVLELPGMYEISRGFTLLSVQVTSWLWGDQGRPCRSVQPVCDRQSWRWPGGGAEYLSRGNSLSPSLHTGVGEVAQHQVESGRDPEWQSCAQEKLVINEMVFSVCSFTKKSWHPYIHINQTAEKYNYRR